MERLLKLSKLDRFTSVQTPGRATSDERRVPEEAPTEAVAQAMEEHEVVWAPRGQAGAPPENDEGDEMMQNNADDSGDETDREEQEGLGEAFETVARVTGDGQSILELELAGQMGSLEL
jgi:hypothetical protein